MSIGLIRTTLCMALLGLTACGAAPDAEGEPGHGLDGPDRTLVWERHALYEIGGSEAEGWAAFGDIDGVGFDATGNLYVLDSQAAQIHVVSPDGTLLRSFGAPGQGPGELAQTQGMSVFADGTVAVFDIGKFGLVMFGPDGQWIRDVRVDPATTGFLSPPFIPLPDRTLVAQVGGRITTSPDAQPESGRPVVSVPLEEAGGEPEVVLRGWEPPPPGGVHLPDGTFLRALSRPIKPIPVTPAIEDEERARRLADLETSGGGGTLRIVTLGGSGGSMQAPDMSEMMRGRIEEMAFYPEMQVIEQIATDWNDRIWVRRTSGRPGVPGPTDIITPEEEYLGTLPADGLRIPDAFGPDGLAVWIERDEYDAERLVVGRIAPAR